MITFQLQGADELARVLRTLPDAIQRDRMVKALRRGAEPMRERMGQLAPRGRGRDEDFEHLADNMVISLANRIGSPQGGRWRPRDETEHAVAVGPQKSFFYGLFQEYGTTHHGAQPFMRPAFDSTGGQALGVIRDELWDMLREFVDREVDTSTVGGRFV